MSAEAFLPQGETVLMSWTSSAALQTIALNQGAPVGCNALKVDNQSTVWMFCRADGVGGAGATALPAANNAAGSVGFYVAPGVTRVVRCNPNATTMGVIPVGSAGNYTLSFTPGDGV